MSWHHHKVNRQTWTPYSSPLGLVKQRSAWNESMKDGKKEYGVHLRLWCPHSLHCLWCWLTGMVHVRCCCFETHLKWDWLCFLCLSPFMSARMRAHTHEHSNTLPVCNISFRSNRFVFIGLFPIRSFLVCVFIEVSMVDQLPQPDGKSRHYTSARSCY